MSKKFLSFIFPETIKKQIDAMPTAEMQLKFYKAVTNYGMYGIEPEDLSAIENIIWVSMKDLIDSCSVSRGGAPEGNGNAAKQQKQPKTDKTTETTKNNQNNVVFDKTTETTLNNDNGNDNDNDKVKVKVNDNAETTGNEENNSGLPPPPPPLSESQENYSKIVFEKFRNAGLPCQNGDLFRFQTCDFRLALSRLKGLSSSDVLKAVDNYIHELKNPESYQLREYSFDNFVSSKTFSNCLPANYRPQNFKKFSKEVPKGGGDETDERHFYVKCLGCGKKTLEWKDTLQKYKCDSCGAVFSWEEVDNATEHVIVP